MSATPFTLDPIAQAFLRAAQGGGGGGFSTPPPAPDTLTGGGTSPSPVSSAPDTSDEAMKAMLLGTSQFGKQLAGEQVARMRAADDARSAAMAQQQTLMSNPPQMAPKNAILRVLLGLTGPGRMAEAAYYQPGVEQWELKRKELASRIATLGEQAGEEAKVVTPALGAVYHPFQAAAGLSRAEALKQRAQAYAQDVQNRFKVGMANVGIKQKLLPSEIERNLAQGVLDRALAKVAPERIDLGYAEQDLRANIASEVAQEKSDAQPLLHRFFNSIFEGGLQSAPVTPGSQQPARGVQPLPSQTDRANRIRRSRGGSNAPLGSKDNPIVVK